MKRIWELECTPISTYFQLVSIGRLRQYTNIHGMSISLIVQDTIIAAQFEQKKPYVNCHKYTICQIGTWTHIFVNILNWIILWYMYSFITVWNHNWKNLDAIRAWLFLDCCRNYIPLSCMYLKEEWRKMAKIMNEMDSYWKVML